MDERKQKEPMANTGYAMTKLSTEKNAAKSQANFLRAELDNAQKQLNGAIKAKNDAHKAISLSMQIVAQNSLNNLKSDQLDFLAKYFKLIDEKSHLTSFAKAEQQNIKQQIVERSKDFHKKTINISDMVTHQVQAFSSAEINLQNAEQDVAYATGRYVALHNQVQRLPSNEKVTTSRRKTIAKKVLKNHKFKVLAKGDDLQKAKRVFEEKGIRLTHLKALAPNQKARHNANAKYQFVQDITLKDGSRLRVSADKEHFETIKNLIDSNSLKIVEENQKVEKGFVSDPTAKVEQDSQPKPEEQPAKDQFVSPVAEQPKPAEPKNANTADDQIDSDAKAQKNGIADNSSAPNSESQQTANDLTPHVDAPKNVQEASADEQSKPAEQSKNISQSSESQKQEGDSNQKGTKQVKKNGHWDKIKGFFHRELKHLTVSALVMAGLMTLGFLMGGILGMISLGVITAMVATGYIIEAEHEPHSNGDAGGTNGTSKVDAKKEAKQQEKQQKREQKQQKKQQKREQKQQEKQQKQQENKQGLFSQIFHKDKPKAQAKADEASTQNKQQQKTESTAEKDFGLESSKPEQNSAETPTNNVEENHDSDGWVTLSEDELRDIEEQFKALSNDDKPKEPEDEQNLQEGYTDMTPEEMKQLLEGAPKSDNKKTNFTSSQNSNVEEFSESENKG